MSTTSSRGDTQSSRKRSAPPPSASHSCLPRSLHRQTENPPSQSPGSTYDDYPSPDFPTSPRSKGPTPPPNPRLTRTSDDRDRPGSTGTRRRPSEDDFGSSNRRSEDPYGGVGDDAPFPPSSRRRPSEDLRQDPAGRRPSAASASDSTSTTNAQSATAKSQMIIPNKSTIAEEDIEVPYGRDARESGSTAGEEPDPDEMEGGLSALTRRLGSVDEDGGPAQPIVDGMRSACDLPQTPNAPGEAPVGAGPLS